MDHQVIDERSREMHALIAERLRARPELLEVAKANLQRWLDSRPAGEQAALLEWRELIDGPFGALLEFLTSKSERAIRLRQSSPFAGEEFLSREVRTELLLRYHDPR